MKYISETFFPHHAGKNSQDRPSSVFLWLIDKIISVVLVSKKSYLFSTIYFMLNTPPPDDFESRWGVFSPLVKKIDFFRRIVIFTGKSKNFGP